MDYIRHWWRQPQKIFLRRAIFQIHLWTGIGLGLYVFFISITGSAIVFRNELYQHYTQRPKNVAIAGSKLAKPDLTKAAERAHPGWGVSYIWESKKPNEPTEIWLTHGGSKIERYFDPYTGADMGRSIPIEISIIKWIADLHTDLLLGKNGRIANGWGGFFLTLLCMTGMVIWWPGIRGWKRALAINFRANWKRFNWDLHSVVGFWTLSITFIFGITGAYLVFTMPFQRVINYFAPLNVYKIIEPDAELIPPAPATVQLLKVADDTPPQPPPRRGRRPPPNYSFGDKIVRWSSYLHFGNFAGWKTKVLWIVLGLLPPFLFVTGFIMWWNRVLSKEARRSKKRQAEPVAVAV